MIDWNRPLIGINWFDLENKKIAIEVRRESKPIGLRIIAHELDDNGKGTGRTYQIAYFTEIVK